MARRRKTREQLAEPAFPVTIRPVTPTDAERLAVLHSDGCAPSPLWRRRVRRLHPPTILSEVLRKRGPPRT